MSFTRQHLTGSRNLERLRQWFDTSRQPGEFWLGKHCVLVAWVGLFIAVISPPHGSGIPLCFFQASTGVPCLGCGLTRSLSCAIRGTFLESWHYHPMGLLILVLFAFTALQSLLPKHQRLGLIHYLKSHSTLFNALYLTFVCAFVTFGTTRALLHLSNFWMPLH